MAGYYQRHLSGERLQKVYEIASPRIREYLQAELQHVIGLVSGMSRVLELGCGYGRALKEIAPRVDRAVGADVSSSTLKHATEFLRETENCDLVRMDAYRTGFRDNSFDAVICIQNGISAFGQSRPALLTEALRVAGEGGLILFSSYSPRFWDARLDWFRAQASAGLVGPIDEEESRAGVIACKDGFRSVAVTGEEFSTLFLRAGQRAQIREVDGSSVFAEVVKRARRPESPRP